MDAHIVDSKYKGRIDFALDVIRTYSPSQEERGVANLIHKELLLKGFRPKIDGAGNVVCEYGDGPTTLLLCGHMDTVPGDLAVKKSENDELYGRGACDAKGPLLSLLFAFEDIATSKHQGRIVFAGVTCEELTSTGLAELIKNNIRSDFAIFGEPGGTSRITVGYRGHMTIHVEVNTPEVHASAPKLTTNAAEFLFDLYTSMKQGLNAVNSDSTDRISASLTQVSGGSAHNVIPGKATATIDVRVPFGLSIQEAMKKINDILTLCQQANPEAKISLSLKDSTDPYRVRLNSPLVRAVSRSILKSGMKPSMITKSGTGDMNTYAMTFGIDAVTYGPGDAKLSHTSEEHVNFNEILSCSSIIVGAARELMSMKTKPKSE